MLWYWFCLFSLMMLQASGPAWAADSPGVVINEILAANSSVNYDTRFYQFSDWIELYNPSAEDVNLRGWYLSDDLSRPRQWRILRGEIPAGGRLLIWADGQGGAFDHASFSLSRSGETLGLFNSAAELVDVLVYPRQIPNVSYGRAPDGGSSWRFFADPSPEAANPDAGVESGAQCEAPVFTGLTGFHSQPFSVRMKSALAGDVIRYTVDGSEPTETSARFVPFTISESTVVRARAFRDGVLPSPVATQSFFIDEPVELPVVSIAVDERYLFDNRIGIYVSGTNGKTGYCSDVPRNYNQDWERAASVEFYDENHQLGFQLDAGISIFGGCSRGNERKSIAVTARDQYGADSFEYPLFSGREATRFKSFVLRNSGNDCNRSLLRDAFMQELTRGFLDIDVQDYRPAVLYVNGEYWGLFNIREKINEHYLTSNYGYDKDEVDLLFNQQQVMAGSADDYKALVSLIDSRSLRDDDAWRELNARMDVNEYINYQIAEIYYGNTDWPNNNIKYWRPHREWGRWRWILFDTDFGYNLNSEGVGHNTLAYAADATGSGRHNPAWSTLLFRKCLENEEFKRRFIQRFCAALATAFDSDHAIATLEAMSAEIAPEVSRHIQRWKRPSSFTAWENELSGMRTFARGRPRVIPRQLNDFFDLGAQHELRLTRIGQGRVYAEGALVKQEEFAADFFEDYPVELKASASPGWRFVRWEGAASGTSDTVMVPMGEDAEVTAVFEAGPGLVINEIQYHPYDGSGNQQYEFVELYNAGGTTIDLSGARFSEGIEYRFGEGVTMAPGAYRVIAADARLYAGLSAPVDTWFEGKLANEGERLRLIDAQGGEIASVEYGVSAPWDDAADGSGRSLSLVDPAAGLSGPENWRASDVYGGTPGEVNFTMEIGDWRAYDELRP
ncbi:MAG: hypothetical protein GC154_01715 [bacterium]|nr:hypothetical protein [bacterium]